MEWLPFIAGTVTFILLSMVRLNVLFLVPALGEIFAQRSGILSIGLEAYMLMAAFTAYLGCLYTGNVWFGLLMGIIGSIAMCLITAILCVRFGLDQIVTGIALNIFALGLTSFLYRSIIVGTFGRPPPVPSFKSITIPIISEIPIIGEILFKQNYLTYISLALIPICMFVLFRTTYGLKITAVGDNPLAADSMGINIHRIRYQAILIGGMLAGIGGAAHVLAYLSSFTEGITAGRGFIVIAIVILSKWNPLNAFSISLLFSGTLVVQYKLQAMGVGIPYPFLIMLPYIATIIALIGVIGKITLPRALAMPYVKER